MGYEEKKSSNGEFKRLVEVQRRTFDEMVKVMQDTVSTKQMRGYPNLVYLDNQVSIRLQYW
jgi:hypothetical protein